MEEMEDAPPQVAADLAGQARSWLPCHKQRPQALGAAQSPLDKFFYRALKVLGGISARSRGRKLVEFGLKGLLDELALAPKVIIDCPFRNASAPSDLLHRGPLTTLSKELQRRGEKALTS